MEVELKVRLADDEIAALRATVEALRGAGTTSRQEDLFFSHPSRDLAAHDEAFRLRRDGERMVLTYKGPREAGDLKARPEHNVAVHDDPEALLAGLGFRPAARLVKTRTRWRFDDAEVLLDHVDGLGWFVEIEASHDAPDASGVVEALRARLGLEGHQAIWDSYLEMALAASAPAATRVD